MEKIWVITYEEGYSDGNTISGVLPTAYKTFLAAQKAMEKAWEYDRNKLIENGMSEEKVEYLTDYCETRILFEQGNEWTLYEMKELEME